MGDCALPLLPIDRLVGICFVATPAKREHFNVNFVMRQWFLSRAAPIVSFPYTFSIDESK